MAGIRNVEDAIMCVEQEVDVNSGCWGLDGRRDKEKVAKFVKNANVAE